MKASACLVLAYEVWCLVFSYLSVASPPPFRFRLTVQVENVYSVLYNVKTVIETCQTTCQPAGPDDMQQLVVLMTDTLETLAPLAVEHVPPVGTKKEDRTFSEKRQPDDLTATGEATRLAFRTAIIQRVVDQRCGSRLYKHRHLFDSAMLLNPVARSLKYLDRVNSSNIGKTENYTADASVVKSRVREQFTNLVTHAVQAKRSQEEAKGADGEPSRVQRARGSKGGRPDKASLDGTVEECRYV
ncbi:MAG: hypothetical protein ABJL35_17015 [Parasphingorhabdus sp.]|uniref:hypothetical protein n=1 Tax=Parasphingorhabdus sp. TaxID=2709688 RepID=UPI003296D06B